MKKIRVHLVNHTHWDREWYFSSQDSTVLSNLLFTDAIAELEKHPQVNFTLDGQSSILEDYLQIRPEMLPRVEKLIKAGQLIIGPWYTQPDALHTSGESLLRNGIIGHLTAQKYGPVAKIGYLPDTFGFNPQMPVILNEVGLNNFIFWRGIDPKRTGGPYFNWQSLGGGSKVTAINLPQGYGVCKQLTGSKDFVKQSLDPAVRFIRDHSSQPVSDVLIPVGNDQMAIKKELERDVTRIAQIGEFEYEISDYASFAEQIRQSGGLNDYVGTMIEPVLARVHRTCGSSRMDIKIAASRLEAKLVGQVEPVMLIGQKCGLDLKSGVLVAAWKKLLASQAHDSLAGSINDSVAADVLHRLKEANEIADGIVNTIERMLAEQLNLAENQILFVNPLPKESNDYQKVRLVTHEQSVIFPAAEDTALVSQQYVPARANVFQETLSGAKYGTEPGYYISDYLVKVHLPALGYKVLEFVSDDQDKCISAVNSAKMTGQKITVEFAHGSLYLKHASSSVQDFLVLTESGNTGDTYDSSPLLGEEPSVLHFDFAQVFTSGKITTMILKGRQKLPYDLTERKQQKKTTDFKYELELRMFSDDHLTVHLKFENNVLDHKLTLKIRTPKVAQYQAGVPYGSFQYQENDLTDWQEKYAEKPVSVWPFVHWVTACQDNLALTVFSNDVKEFVKNADSIDLTLLATTDQLGKEDLVNRPGRASGDTTQFGHPQIPTPQAELQQAFEYDFVVDFGEGSDLVQGEQIQERETFAAFAYQKQGLNLFLNRLDNKLQPGLATEVTLPAELSLLKIPEEVTVTACYPSYLKGHGLVVRLNNGAKEAVDYVLPKNAQAVNALEEPVEYGGVIDALDVLTILI